MELHRIIVGKLDLLMHICSYSLCSHSRGKLENIDNDSKERQFKHMTRMTTKVNSQNTENERVVMEISGS